MLHSTLNQFHAGSARIFITSDNGLSWSETQKILGSSGTGSGTFGCQVAIYSNIVVVGAYADSNTNAG